MNGLAKHCKGKHKIITFHLNFLNKRKASPSGLEDQSIPLAMGILGFFFPKSSEEDATLHPPRKLPCSSIPAGQYVTAGLVPSIGTVLSGNGSPA